MKILITPTSLKADSPAVISLKEIGGDLVFNPYDRPLSERELIPLLKDCDGYLAGLDNVTARVIEESPKLKVISRYGVGCDRVDLCAAAQKHVTVTNTPGANSEAVGELAFSIILALARKLTYLNEKTKMNQWVRTSGMELKGKCLGILGLGAVGKVVARCAAGMEMEIKAYDPFIDEIYCAKNNIQSVSLRDIIEGADVISLHLPLSSATYHMINRDVIASMKKNVIWVNTSRGGLIDENAALDALENGKIGGLGLDAYEEEPPKNSPLFLFDNVLLTPHSGAHTKEAADKMAAMAVQNLKDVLLGKHCDYIVNQCH